MPQWRFWQRDDREDEPPLVPSTPDSTPGRFNIRPRTDTVDPSADAATADQLTRLRARREAVLFDVEQAELAKQPDNPWRERVALIDQTIAIVAADLDNLAAEHGSPGPAIDPVPVEELAAVEGPPPAVTFRIGNERFRYEEDLDWSERGHQLARSDLQLREGTVSAILPAGLADADLAALEEHLAGSLFVFASDTRDRLLAGDPLPTRVTLADLAKPAEHDGGWLDWSGTSPAGQKRHWRRQELEAEQQRLYADRAHELEEQARWVERLPIARRRLRDVEKEIEALGAN